MRAAPEGTGIIAGGPMRAVFEDAGHQGRGCRNRWGSQNPYNMIRAHHQRPAKGNEPPHGGLNAAGKKVADILRRGDESPCRSGASVRERDHGKKPSSSNRSARRSARPAKQRATLVGLGLNKMHKISELEDTPSVRGMIAKIPHLVEIVEERGVRRGGVTPTLGKLPPPVSDGRGGGILLGLLHCTVIDPIRPPVVLWGRFTEPRNAASAPFRFGGSSG